MSKFIYADVSVDEKRVAIVEEGRLIDLHIQRVEDKRNIGNIYVGVIQNVLEGINSCFVDIGSGKNAFLPISDYSGDIKKGEKVLVQISKEEFQDKGAKVTGKIALPIRHLVYTPTESKIGVSRNIVDFEERKRLRGLLSSFTPKGSGFVARSRARNKSEKELHKEAKFLIKLWMRIQKEVKKAKKAGTPMLVYQEADIVTYAVREFLDKKVEAFFINDKLTYKRIYSFVKKIFPEFKNKVKYYEDDMELFERYKIETQIDNLMKRKISLDCGGYIIIEQTEALTAIDVNTGSFTEGTSREETAMKVNTEAARMAASQIILRDIGGIVIIDFIDLEKRANRFRLHDILKNEMRLDKAKLKIYPMGRLGLIELTRQRRRESIVDIIGMDCPYCMGSGMIFSETTMYIKIKRELLKKGPSVPSKVINLFLHPRVAEIFDKKGIDIIQKTIGKKIKLRRDYKLHHEEFKITA